MRQTTHVLKASARLFSVVAPGAAGNHSPLPHALVFELSSYITSNKASLPPYFELKLTQLLFEGSIDKTGYYIVHHLIARDHLASLERRGKELKPSSAKMPLAAIVMLFNHLNDNPTYFSNEWTLKLYNFLFECTSAEYLPTYHALITIALKKLTAVNEPAPEARKQLC